MSKFIKYHKIGRDGVQYEFYLAVDIIRSVGPIIDEEGKRSRKRENACMIITRDNTIIGTDSTLEEIMAQLAPELVYGKRRRLPPQFINTMAFLAALNNFATVYLKSADEADKTNDEYQKAFCRGKAFAIKQVIAMAERWQDKQTEEE